MILVIGATGFIGQHLILQLAHEQYPICALVRPSRFPRRFTPGITVQIVTGDIDNAPALRLAMHQVDTVFHLATDWRAAGDPSGVDVNVRDVERVIDAMLETGVKRLIALSMIGADTHSAYRYLRSKGLTDETIVRSGLDYTILQSSAVYGPGDNWTETIALALRRWPFFFPIPGDGRTRLQPIWINDLIRCMMSCLDNPKTMNKTFAVGGPSHTTYDEVVSLIMQATRRRRSKRYMRPASARSWSNFLRGLLGGYALYGDTDLELLSVDRTTTLDAVSFQFGFMPARIATSLDYLR
jgi:NADH dehydrogenase